MWPNGFCCFEKNMKEWQQYWIFKILLCPPAELFWHSLIRTFTMSLYILITLLNVTITHANDIIIPIYTNYVIWCNYSNSANTHKSIKRFCLHFKMSNHKIINPLSKKSRALVSNTETKEVTFEAWFLFPPQWTLKSSISRRWHNHPGITCRGF